MSEDIAAFFEGATRTEREKTRTRPHWSAATGESLKMLGDSP